MFCCFCWKFISHGTYFSEWNSFRPFLARSSVPLQSGMFRADFRAHKKWIYSAFSLRRDGRACSSVNNVVPSYLQPADLSGANLLFEFNNLIITHFKGALTFPSIEKLTTPTHSRRLWRRGEHPNHYHSLQWFRSINKWPRLPWRRQGPPPKNKRTIRGIYCRVMATVILNASIKCDYLRVLSEIQLLPAQNTV